MHDVVVRRSTPSTERHKELEDGPTRITVELQVKSALRYVEFARRSPGRMLDVPLRSIRRRRRRDLRRRRRYDVIGGSRLVPKSPRSRAVRGVGSLRVGEERACTPSHPATARSGRVDRYREAAIPRGSPAVTGAAYAGTVSTTDFRTEPVDPSTAERLRAAGLRMDLLDMSTSKSSSTPGPSRPPAASTAASSPPNASPSTAKRTPPAATPESGTTPARASSPSAPATPGSAASPSPETAPSTPGRSAR